MRWIIIGIAGAALFAVEALSQVAYPLDAGNPGAYNTVYLPSAAYPTGLAAPGTGLRILPAASELLPAAFPHGGGDVDPATGQILVCDGTMVTGEPHPAYQPFGSLPATFFGPVPLALSGGMVTGLALDAGSALVYAVDDASPPQLLTYTYAPPALLSTGPPLPLTFILNPPLTGLDFDRISGRLWACDAGGNVYDFDTTGLLFNLFSVTTSSPPTGISLNDTNASGAFPPPFCSSQLAPPAFRLCVTDGSFVYDVLGGAAPIALGAATGGPAAGLIVSPDFQLTAGAAPGGCQSSGMVPLIGTAAPMTTGGANALVVAGAPSGVSVIGALDLCPLPGGFPLGPPGDVLHIDPLSPTLSVFGVLTDGSGAGRISFSIPAGIGVSGFQLTWQWIITDPLHSFGVCLSDAATVTVGFGA